jgi:hypothetical protein
VHVSIDTIFTNQISLDSPFNLDHS